MFIAMSPYTISRQLATFKMTFLMNNKISAKEHDYLTSTPAVNFNLSCNTGQYSTNFPFSYLQLINVDGKVNIKQY